MRRMIPLLLMLALVSCTPKAFTIIQIADAQLGFDAAVKGQEPGAEYVNDLTYEVEYLKKAVAEVNKIRPDMVIFTGDQINLPLNDEQWTTFGQIVSGIDKSVMVMHLPGNHDVILEENNVDLTPFSSRYGDDRFAYEDEDLLVVGLNSNFIRYDDMEDETEQFRWLESVLQKDAKVKLVFAHHPFFLTDIDEEDSYFPIQKAKRYTYFDLFARTGVDAVYAGHRHAASEGAYNGIPMKTTTSSAYQLGDSKPSIRLIRVQDGSIMEDKLLELTL